MSTIIFLWYLITGTIVYEKNIDGRNTYRLEFQDSTQITEGNQIFYGKTVDYCYKEEIIEYIETNTFEYNEDL